MPHSSGHSRQGLVVVIYLLGAAFCLTPWANAPMALALGIGLALLGWTAFEHQSKVASRVLIQACVILLGFRMDFSLLLNTAREGLLFAAGTIVGTLALGLLVGRLLKTDREITLLISSGTAVCGGSAIAAVGASIGASATGMAVATGAVFLLNAVALYVFPIVGHALHMSDAQFGTWAGVAIHDMSSVVNAAKEYHDETSTLPIALDTANVVKLSRVLWIVPIALCARWWSRRGEGRAPGTGTYRWRSPVPVFILLFLAASAVRTFVPGLEEWAEQIRVVAGTGFQLALFLIGAGLSRKAVASVGWRAMLLAVVLWVFISVTALVVVRATVG